MSVEKEKPEREDADFEELGDVLEGAVCHRMRTRWNYLGLDLLGVARTHITLEKNA